MKLFCKEEMQRLEGMAERSGVSLSALMENAGRALAEETENRCRPAAGNHAVLLCGKGNNGGDGFVCARHLSEHGMDCTILLIQGQPESSLAKSAFFAMPEEVMVLNLQSRREEAAAALERADVILDCVFGFSFRGEFSGDGLDFLDLANRRDCLKISADLPSGAVCDTGRIAAGAFRADVTVTFTGKKPANCSYPAKEYCGETVVRQVGISPVLLEAAETKFFETDDDFVKSCLKELDPQSNKGTLGRLLLVCGSYGMAGACVMAARAALRCGVGLLHIAVDKSIYPMLAGAVPEAVFTVLDWENHGREAEERLNDAMEKATACLVGCGLGDGAKRLCPPIFSRCTVPLIADADALNFAAGQPGILEEVEAPLILTPHPGEMARLCGDSIPEIQADRLGAAREKARETGAVVALKGAATVIASPDGRCAVNPTGNPGMAKGGAGDVLAGMIASFAAQGIPPFEAAVSGVYLHGLAGDLCAKKLGMRSMLPTDIIEALPEALRR
ncbi:MAG: NAD(P)H-hydrate dehydratase [Acutalibacter sp.]|nr:NAD(P)H-hydrate dehydratase [Acutalibacter sp.]